MTEAKPFQLATINAALKALCDHSGARRFLVADEVGLGKTVVAQHVIAELIKGCRRRPLVVFYVCSSLSIASQNRRKLLELLPEDERRDALCQVDRLTLLPASGRPEHPRLNLYTLTPDTSIPERGGMRRDGRVQERALIHELVRRTWPEFFLKSMYGQKRDFFRRQAGMPSWKWHVQREKQRLDDMEERPLNALTNKFRDAVRRQLGLQPRQWVCKKLVDLNEDLEIIAKLRSALAACAIGDIRPDLVIFDEFQRFRDLLADDIDPSASRVINALRGSGDRRAPALLLLSATPYRLYSRRWEDGQGQSHHEEFFHLIKFLYGNSERSQIIQQDCTQAFLQLELAIRKGRVTSDEACHARKQIRRLLTPVMSRTERASHPDGWENARTEEFQADLQGEDLKIYRHMAESLRPDHRSYAVSYWNSIPLPMQTMGPRYVARKESTPTSSKGVPSLRLKDRDSFAVPKNWSHPRLRSLLKQLPVEKLALPWLPPSLPWWPLKGAWQRNGSEDPGKMLIFSRFRAVPQAVASLISYSLESHFLGQSNLNYQDVTKRRSLTASDKRKPLPALFHPSPWLCQHTDPLKVSGQSLHDVRGSIREQLITALSGLGIEITADGSRRPVWQLLAALEAKAGNWPWIHTAWQHLHLETRRNSGSDEESTKGLGLILEAWDQASQEEITHLSPSELDRLALHALEAPGVVVGRALLRHWSEAISQIGYGHTLQVAWNGLRTYLDQRWFVALLGSDDEKFPRAIQRAVVEGNLEAVLDEHLWIIQKLHGLEGVRLASELKQGLSLRTSHFKLHSPTRNWQQEEEDGKDFSLRCHVAMPFTEARLVSVREDGSEEDLGLRSDDLRKAFNTPFWPYVLTTTSVGQEGLDFHVWCSQLVHWDLCNNPMDLEQREGRIQRFGGLSIRQAIAKELGNRVLADQENSESPWGRLGELADEQLSDESGLQPWWVFQNAAIRRFVFRVPGSEQQQRLAWLKEQRLLYRLALGQPNQEDLLEVVSNRNNLPPEKLKQASIGLSAFFDDE